MLSYLKGKINLFTIMNTISPVWSQVETILDSYLRRALMLIPIAAGVWIINLYISSRRTFARVRRLSSHSEGPPDHIGMKVGYLPGHFSFIPLGSIFSIFLPQIKYFNKRPPGWQAKYGGKNNHNYLNTL